jgi:hypothetical protein
MKQEPSAGMSFSEKKENKSAGVQALAGWQYPLRADAAL